MYSLSVKKNIYFDSILLRNETLHTCSPYDLPKKPGSPFRILKKLNPVPPCRTLKIKRGPPSTWWFDLKCIVGYVFLPETQNGLSFFYSFWGFFFLLCNAKNPAPLWGGANFSWPPDHGLKNPPLEHGLKIVVPPKNIWSPGSIFWTLPNIKSYYVYHINHITTIPQVLTCWTEPPDFRGISSVNWRYWLYWICWHRASCWSPWFSMYQ